MTPVHVVDDGRSLLERGPVQLLLVAAGAWLVGYVVGRWAMPRIHAWRVRRGE